MGRWFVLKSNNIHIRRHALHLQKKDENNLPPHPLTPSPPLISLCSLWLVKKSALFERKGSNQGKSDRLSS
jgi:hypothetical protein